MKTLIVLVPTEAPFLNPDVCGDCGGKCCKTIPGCAFPDDFASIEAAVDAVKSGRWAIDWWEGDPRPDVGIFDPEYVDRGYYLRPAIKGREGETHHPSWGGECTFLTPTGCELEPERRPTECRNLEPKPYPAQCEAHGSMGKQAAALAWLPYHQFLKE